MQSPLNSTSLGRLQPTPRDPNEEFHETGRPLGRLLADFWRWSSSDLVSNATRGCLAEFIVAAAVEDSRPVREEWASFDLLTPEGIRIEVKSAAYLQTWNQREFSRITFSTKPSRGWDAATNLESPELRRQADVYVFALLVHKDKRTVDPLNVDQWRFYVLPTRVLDARERSQHSITLK
ncbi:MAG: hypothetical protein ACT4O1_07175, partial [Gemmatimonadota bacterium]